MTSAWDHLPKEKQNRIISATMDVFAAHGYKKASVSDIAERCGISKAMVFTYFNTKRNCYEFMCNEMLRVSKEEFLKFSDELMAVSDFFDRMVLSAKWKGSILKKYRSHSLFGLSVYFERDEEVADIVATTISSAYKMRAGFLSDGIDIHKFKNPDDAPKVAKMAIWLSSGCADEWSRSNSDSFDEMFEIYAYGMKSLREQFYKEEYI